MAYDSLWLQLGGGLRICLQGLDGQAQGTILAHQVIDPSCAGAPLGGVDAVAATYTAINGTAAAVASGAPGRTMNAALAGLASGAAGIAGMALSATATAPNDAVAPR